MLLKALPGFDQSSWASTVRKEVCIHERYANMVPWVGAETADITYVDGDNTPFTNLLMWRGYEEFAYCLEKGVPLKYYLEVKTTTKECGTRFYTSKAQYRRVIEPSHCSFYWFAECLVMTKADFNRCTGWHSVLIIRAQKYISSYESTI